MIENVTFQKLFIYSMICDEMKIADFIYLSMCAVGSGQCAVCSDLSCLGDNERWSSGPMLCENKVFICPRGANQDGLGQGGPRVDFGQKLTKK